MSFSSDDSRSLIQFQTGDDERYLRTYSSVIESVEHYYLLISKLSSYKRFRQKRWEGESSSELLLYMGSYHESDQLGGDQQLGAMICEGNVNLLIFFWDPMQPQPHDVDVKALLRIAVLYNIPTASNRSTADFIISSPLFHIDYKPIIKDYTPYIKRNLDI